MLSDNSFNSPSPSSPLRGVSDISVEGNEVTWILEVARPDLSEYLSEDWSFGIISKQHWDAVGGEEGYEADPIGTGAFSFLDQTEDGHLLFERNAGHYRKEPHFAELQFTWIEQLATIYAVLITAEAHIGYIPPMDFSFTDTLKERNLKISRGTLPSFQLSGEIPWYLPEAIDGSSTPNYNMDSPTQDSLIREALNLAIDRNIIYDVFFESQAIPSAVSVIPYWWDTFEDTWAPFDGPSGRKGHAGGWPYPYNPELARDLIHRTDHSDRLDIDLYIPVNLPDFPGLPELAFTLTNMWDMVGIRTNLIQEDQSTITQMINERSLSRGIILSISNPKPLSRSIESLWRQSATPTYEYPFITEWFENYQCQRRDRIDPESPEWN